MRDSLFNSRRFLPLFKIQFLNAMSDHLLKNAILVLITYHGLVIHGFGEEVSVNIAVLTFLLPFLLFSSYAGKLADSYSKVSLIRLIKYGEIIIVLLAAAGFILPSMWLLLCSLLLMGIHSSLMGPIKYSILPQYINQRSQLLLAIGYVELGTFVAILCGQILGSWYMANHQLTVIIALLAASNVIGLLLSYRLELTPALNTKSEFHWNVFKDIHESYTQVMAQKAIRNNLHAISWFYALGVIYTTQLPLFTERYLGGGAKVFTILLALFSLSIGLGSAICSHLAHGVIKRRYVLWGALGIGFFTLVLLVVNSQLLTTTTVSLYEFSHTWHGLVNFLLIFLIGYCAGFYSVTCYNELQLITPANILSKVLGVNNILNAIYMVVASLACTLLLLIVNLWCLFILTIIANCVFIYWYWRKVMPLK